MINHWIKYTCTCFCTILLISCGDDDGGDTPTLPDLTDLAGDWVDESVSSEVVDDGFIALVFDVSDSSAAVSAATPNEAGISCEDLIFRNITPTGTNTFSGEGLLSSGSDYEEVTLTLVDEHTINIDWECTSCTPAVDVLTKLSNESEAFPIILSADIDEETTFYDIVCDPDKPDYVVTDYIQVKQHLIINPNVIIAFEASAGIHVSDINGNGSISAVGNSQELILFTGLEKQPGFWKGISVQSNDVRNELNHAVVEYAGSDALVGYAGVDIKGGIAIESTTGFPGSLTIENSIIRNNDGYGFIVEGGTQLRSFANNEFENNEEAAVRIDANNVGALDGESNYLGSNGFDGVEINASGSPIHDITSDATWPSLFGGAAYRVVQSFDVRATLAIEPGTTIEFEANQTMYLKQDFSGPNDGTLIAKGIDNDSITFTGVMKTPGYWRGLVIQSNTSNDIQRCIIEYGGSDLVTIEPANVVLDKDGAYDPPSAIVVGNTIRHSAGCGVVYNTGSGIVSGGNIFSNNNGPDYCAE